MLYEGGIRSPLVVWAPGLIEPAKSGTVNRASVFAAIDLVPTLLEIAGAESPGDVRFDGQALPGVLLGRSEASRDEPLFFRRPPDRDVFYGVADLPDLAVRHGKWKLLCEYDGSEPQLYDLEGDRGEAASISVRHPDVVRRLTGAVVAWHEALPPDAGETYVTLKKDQ